MSAARFARRGLAGLIAWPASEPVFTGPVLGGTRPRWSPHDDPRMDALAAGFAFLLGVETGRATGVMMEVTRMKAAIYARVSTDSQQLRGTIGSQLAVLRARRRSGGRRVGRGVLRRRAFRRPAGPARAGQPAGRRRGRL